MAVELSRPPLHRYRVVDFTTFLSGPFASQILADLGAEVVKIETPDGDMTRGMPPYQVGEDSAYFLSTNRGKKSLAVDLKTAGGRALALDLIGQADVVVENFRPGVTGRLGFDVSALRVRHPRLIWASITGFGQTGPMRDKPAYDMIVQALSGVMSLTGEPGRPAVRLGIPAGDVIPGMYAVIAITAALADRERSGVGRVIDVAMLDCLLAMLSYQSAYALIGGASPGRQGARHDSIPTYRSFTAGDGMELVVTATTQKMWSGFCVALGRPELVDDPRFRTPGLRLANKDELWAAVEPEFLARTAEEWVRALEAADVPCALIKSVPQALADAKAAGRSMIISYESPGGETVDLVGDPMKFTEPSHAEAAAYPPRLGVHAKEVLSTWLGLGDHEIEQLISNRVLFSR